MPLFTQSTKAVSAVVTEIADAVGASADAEMQTRAFKSLNAGIEYLNGRANWDFLLTEADPISIVGPLSVTGVTAASGQTSAAAPAGHGFLVDDLLAMPGVVLGTRITATAASGFGFNSTLTNTVGTGTVQTATATRDMYALPSAWKSPYSVRLLAVPSTLRPLRRRFYDRSILNEFQASTPVGYDVFTIGGKGKIRMLPPPSAPDVLELRYYRRMTVGSATADGTMLDIPQDYEPYLIAWSKWHFIMDKGEGRSEQGSTWLAFAQDGFKQMLSDQTRLPDEDLMFVPGAVTYNPAWTPNMTRYIDWDR